MKQTNNLSELRILITRPQRQAERLAAQLQPYNIETILYPCLEIELLPERYFKSAIIAWKQTDIAIFTSVHAVAATSDFIKKAWPQFPKQLKIAAIGPATGEALQAEGLPVDLMPINPLSSERLLTEPLFADLTGKNIQIIKGMGGREKLEQQLASASASVDVVNCYQRVQPQLTALTREQRDVVSIVLVTSAEGFANLWGAQSLDGQAWLKQVTLIVMSERIKAMVRSQGCEGAIAVCESLTVENLLSTLRDLKPC